jgi:beta-lactam-binding protein with PASTA domain
VKGKSLSIARRRIAAAHCRIGHIRRVKSRKPKGIVLAQRPRAGKTLPRASRVSLVVSRGGKR